MSEEGNFVARWSRLKRKNTQDRKEAPGTPSRDAKQDTITDSAASSSNPQDAPVPFDVSQLPSIDALTASSDIRAFLQSGVPGELTRAALRKVWTTDPAIRDFIGIAENQWDFTDPTSIPGFGPLGEHEDVAKLVAQAMGKLEQAPPTDVGTAVGASKEPSVVFDETPDTPKAAESPASATCEFPIEECPAKELAAAQHGEHGTPDKAVTNRRTHGRALPR
jgi:hypothetical protein